MQSKDKIIDKANFYSMQNVKCHIKIIPTGFRNGFIISELINDKYFWFIDERDLIFEQRLFLSEIEDIEDYKEEEK